MGKSVTKTVKVPESMAEEWERYVEENPEADSISHLIRQSVELRLQGKYSGPQRVVEGSDDADSGEVLTALRQLQTGMNDLQERMNALERVGEAEASYDLQKAVFSFLPEERRSSKYADWAITCEELAQKLGANEGDVQDTLDNLGDGTGQVASVSGGPDGETYWFKRGK
jgi:Arc/MetJ-type ribon-helix-helix transcriptional regulator